MKKSLCAILAVMILMIGIVPAFAVDMKSVKPGMTLYVKTSGGNLNMRESASPKAAIIFKLPFATPVTASSEHSNGFLKVTYSVGSVRHEGWVDVKYLSTTKPSGGNTDPGKETEKDTVAGLSFRSYKLVPQGTTHIVSAKPSRNGGFVNLRWAPSMDSAVIERMLRGEQMTVITEGNKWMQVRCADGWVGFIMKSFTNDVFNGKTAVWEAMQADQ